MVVEPRKRRAPNVRDMVIMSGRSLTENRADTILFRVAREGAVDEEMVQMDVRQ